MDLFERMAAHDYEQVVTLQNRATGLRGFLAIHDTTRGPAMGGVRITAYPSEDAALTDALRLSRAMTYKAALADLPCGGGKTVLMLHPALVREAALEGFGRFVESLRGRYFCARDVGITDADLAAIARGTRHVACDPAPGLGDVSENTAIGVWHGMRAAAEFAGITGRIRIALQGVGSVGAWLARIIARDGLGGSGRNPVELIVADMDSARAAAVARETGARSLPAEEILSAPCDILAPCALGAVLDSDTVPRLQCRAVCGCANNILATLEDGDALMRRGVLYAPDYLVNAGGLLRGVEFFLMGLADSRPSLARIYQRALHVFRLARDRGISTARAADELAVSRLKPRKTFGDATWSSSVVGAPIPG